MVGVIAKYRQRLQHEHGWEVELKCRSCGTVAAPQFSGWTPSRALNFGHTPTIFANISCPKCGAGVRDAAGSKLVELFADVALPTRNRQLILGGHLFGIIALIAFVPIAAGVGFAPALLKPGAATAVFAVASMRLYFVWLNWQLAGLRHECECGEPAYKFMGLLGRSYCYRCTTCGRRLRLRD